MVMEECAEVSQACGKVLRHGYDSEYNGITDYEFEQAAARMPYV